MSHQAFINQETNSQGGGTSSGGKYQYPSLYGLTCPKCKQADFKIRGTKGSYSKEIGLGAAFGAVGMLISSAMSENDYQFKPIQYKCKCCGHKFQSFPLVAQPEELLAAPCTINFKRLSAFTGMAVAQHVWLNGMKVGSVGNGKTLVFKTFVKYNTIFVTDHMGVALKGNYKFEAPSGGTVEVRYKRKFV